MRLRLVEDGEFKDEGVSGTAELRERTGLQALLARVIGDGVGVVLIERADRLSRDLVTSELILGKFREHNIRVVECENGNDLTAGDASNPTAALIRQVLGAVSQFDKDSVVAKLRTAREAKRAKGERCDGVRPFGLEPGEKEIVELIFKLRRKGPGKKRRTLQQIADELTRRGIKTPGAMRENKFKKRRVATKWSVTTVYDILKRGNDIEALEKAPSPA